MLSAEFVSSSITVLKSFHVDGKHSSTSEKFSSTRGIVVSFKSVVLLMENCSNDCYVAKKII